MSGTPYQRWNWRWAAALCIALLAACATSPTGRNQLLLISDSEVGQMGAAAFDQMKNELPVAKNTGLTRYVSCVGDSILATLPGQEGRDWEIVVFEDDSANAFALPGKKIGVHSGLLKVAVNADQLATVIGHEIGHVQARHSAERVSLQYAAQTGQQLAGVLLGEAGPQRDTLMGMLGLGAQYGLVLPYGRVQESEADVLGLRLMAQAGYDPRESIALWRNMSSASKGQQPPEFLSTHPSHETRIQDLEKNMGDAVAAYQRARASGLRPNCKPPG